MGALLPHPAERRCSRVRGGREVSGSARSIDQSASSLTSRLGARSAGATSATRPAGVRSGERSSSSQHKGATLLGLGRRRPAGPRAAAGPGSGGLSCV